MTSVRPGKFRGLQRRDREKQALRFIGKSSPTRGRRNYTNKLINKAKRDHIRQKICENKNNSKELFRIVDGLLKHTKPGENMPASDDTPEMTETFSSYFIDKIDRIRKELDESNLSPKNDTCVTKKTTHETILNSFSPASEEEVNKILKNLPNKTCSHDAFPTWILKECANELTPAITLIINCSLELGEMPCILKRAVVRPALKKIWIE